MTDPVEEECNGGKEATGEVAETAKPAPSNDLNLWSLIEILSPLSPMTLAQMEKTEDTKKEKKKKIRYGFRESLVPDDYVPPPKKHPVVFEGSMIGKELHVRNFYRHFACYKPTNFNEELVDELQKLGEYKPPAWYSSMLCSAAPTLVEHEVKYERVELYDSTGGLLAVDWAFPEANNCCAVGEPSSDCVLCVFPGLAGHSDKDYIRSFVKRIMTALKWKVCVLNWRGFNCPLKNGKVSSPVDLTDMTMTIYHASKRFPTSPIFAAGFSMGSNQLVKYIGMNAENHMLTAAMSVCNGFEYEQHLQRLEKTPLGEQIYSRGMTYLHQEYLRNYGEELRQHVEGFELEKALAAAKHSELDEVLVKQVYGYHDMQEYYEQIASRPFIPKVNIPLLCLQSGDDPLFTEGDWRCWQVLPVDELHDNKHIVYFESEYGSHLNFVEATISQGLLREDFTFCDRAAEAFFRFASSQSDQKLLF